MTRRPAPKPGQPGQPGPSRRQRGHTLAGDLLAAGALITIIVVLVLCSAAVLLTVLGWAP